MKQIHKVVVKPGKVTLTIVERDYWGAIKKRQQMTFTKRHFDKALSDAEITVPWKDLNIR